MSSQVNFTEHLLFSNYPKKPHKKEHFQIHSEASITVIPKLNKDLTQKQKSHTKVVMLCILLYILPFSPKDPPWRSFFSLEWLYVPVCLGQSILYNINRFPLSKHPGLDKRLYLSGQIDFMPCF